MKKILVLFAHPALQKSRVNIELIKGLGDIQNITFHDLYQVYPELDIDIRREQDLLLQHDVIILHHPFFWYSAPSIIKEWQDLVLEHGWAYGHEGHALDGKVLVTAVSTGGAETAYCKTGSNRFSMRQLLAPIEQTARLCGMVYLPPFVVHGTHALGDDGIGRYSADYRRLLEGLRDDRVPADRAAGLDRINSDLDTVLGG